MPDMDERMIHTLFDGLTFTILAALQNRHPDINMNSRVVNTF